MAQSVDKRYWLWGLLYGLTLMFWSFGATGAGHGTYVPLGLSSSPLGWLGVSVAFVGLLVLWAGVGFLLGRAKDACGKIQFILAAAAHYLSIPPLLSGEIFGDWDYLNKMTGFTAAWLLSGLVIYFVGQVVLWAAFFRMKRLS